LTMKTSAYILALLAIPFVVTARDDIPSLRLEPAKDDGLYPEAPQENGSSLRRRLVQCTEEQCIAKYPSSVGCPKKCAGLEKTAQKPCRVDCVRARQSVKSCVAKDTSC